MLKKICIAYNCEEVYDVDKVYCPQCKGELYYYLALDSILDKIKSIFLKDDEEELIILELKQLKKWETLFKNFKKNLKSPSNDFFKQIKEFKKSKSNFKYLNKLRVDDDNYNFLLSHYYLVSIFIDELDEDIDKFKDLNLNDITLTNFLNYLREDNENKHDYVDDVTSKLEDARNLKNYKYIKFYDTEFKSVIGNINKINGSFEDIEGEINKITDLNKDFDEFKNYFNNNSDKPSNYDNFKKELSSLKYLDVLQYFGDDLDNTVKQANYIITNLNEIDEEQDKIARLSKQFKEFKDEFDGLIDENLSDSVKQTFLDKYVDFIKDINSFKHLNLLNDVDCILEAQEFLKYFNKHWNDLILRKEEIILKNNFKKDFNKFNQDYKFLVINKSNFNLYDFNRKEKFFKLLSNFSKDFKNLQDNYKLLLKEEFLDKYKFALEMIAILDKEIEIVNSQNYDNFNMSFLLNFLNDSSINDISKQERVNKFKDILADLELPYFDFLGVFDKTLNVFVEEVKKLKKFFNDVNKECDILKGLKPILDDYNNSRKFPKNVKEIKETCSNFEYLDFIPFFSLDLSSYVDNFLDINKVFNEVDNEIAKLSLLILDASKFIMEFEMLPDKFVSKDQFLDKYPTLERDIRELKYLDIIPQIDDSLKDLVVRIKEVKEIFDDFDNRWAEIVAKHEELERILSYSTQYKEFYKSWNNLLSNFVDEDEINSFLNNYLDLEEIINSFSWVDTQKAEYQNAIDEAKDIIFKLQHIDDFIKVNEANLSIFEFFNICDNKYFGHRDKAELFLKYQSIFDDIDNLEKISNNIDFKIHKLDDFKSAFNDFDKFIVDSNEKFVEKELDEYKSFFDDFKGKSFDDNQRNAIVRSDDNMQILAGAGCGKTLTICGKVNYLIEKGVDSSKILCLSYSSDSADDLVDKLPEGVEAYTFHKLGKDILEESGLPYVPDEKVMEKTLKNFFENYLFKNDEFLAKVMDYFTYYQYDPVDRRNKNLGEILEIEEGRNFKTLKERYTKSDEKRTFKDREIVKSFEELVIANYLFIHGIDYEYEKDYSVDDEKVDLGYKYQPDFYLGNNIYLEHFGVNRNLEAPWLDEESSNDYREKIFSKRETHEEHGTTLLETYSYFMSEGILIEELEKILEEEGIEIQEVDYNKILSQLAANDRIEAFSPLSKLIESFINLFKGKNYSRNKLDEFKKQAANETDETVKSRHLLFLDIVEYVYDSYQKYLEDSEKIDFDDMINDSYDVIVNGKVTRNYDYIIVDEYQDISYTRYKLLEALKKVCGAKLFVVGDDWQAIYKFSGCDLNLFTNFEDYFPNSQQYFIDHTYRNSQSLIDIAGKFIKKNKNQINKTLHSNQSSNIENPIKIAYYKNKDIFSKIDALEACIKDISKHSKDILILYRYNSSIKPYVGEVNGKNKNKFKKYTPFKKENNKLIYTPDSSLNIDLLTVHKSKGLEADNVIILDLEDSYFGFPSQKENDSVLEYVNNKDDGFKYSEERRLFYVAITRTKKYNYFLVNEAKPSEFVTELEDFTTFDVINKIEHDYENENEVRTGLKCPVCKTGDVIIFKNKQGKRFFKCSHINCDWFGGSYYGRFEDLDLLEICSSCRGVIHVAHGKSSPYGACSNKYISQCDGGNRLKNKVLTSYGEEEAKKYGWNWKFHKTGLKCPDCGEDIQIIQRENYSYFVCVNKECDWFGGYYRGKFDDLDILEHCSSCDGVIHVAHGKSSPYATCSNKYFSQCDGGNRLKNKVLTSYGEEEAKKYGWNWKFHKTGLKCPDCGEDIQIIQRENYSYFVCVNKECDWFGGYYRGKFDDLDILEHCPSCDGIVYVRDGKYGPFSTCSKRNREFKCDGGNILKEEVMGRYDKKHANNLEDSK